MLGPKFGVARAIIGGGSVPSLRNHDVKETRFGSKTVARGRDPSKTWLALVADCEPITMGESRPKAHHQSVRQVRGYDSMDRSMDEPGVSRRDRTWSHPPLSMLLTRRRVAR